MNDSHAYLADGQPVDAAAFTARACDPARSVVVEACAGSGKTWLLVSRIVRLLLAGAQPGEIVAITFTRRAAQEMQARLLRELQQLALAADAQIVAALSARGLPPADAAALVPAARGLFEHVATARVPLTIETFHSWFWRLVARAPLGCGVPFSPRLLEASERARSDAWLHFLAVLLRPEHAAERAAWETLLDELGESSAAQLLRELLHRRAEWWSYALAHDTPHRQALAVFGEEADTDPAADVRAAAFVDALRELAALWREVPAMKTAQTAADRAEAWLAGPPVRADADFRAACRILLIQEGTPAKLLLPDALARKLRQPQRYTAAHGAAISELERLRAARIMWRARRINAAGLTCGTLLIDSYQQIKAHEHALDFTDLEWHAYRLLADPDQAAYMQARLDAQCRHLLLDEFQDTNALQWQVLQSWLAAYGPLDSEAAPDRPTVFVVGDPKQSIYRFRRAEPRVFDAALELLRRDFGAAHLRTNVTRRNAPAIVALLNATLGDNPLFQAQSTLADPAVPGAFVLLPLAEPDSVVAAVNDAALRDVLTTPRVERAEEARYREGRVVANELRAWHGRRRAGALALRWADMLLLVRRRNHLGEYERALRDAGVPFISDRSGGLLATLEADDFAALLTFLTTPHVDLRLAHSLRSPLFGCEDDDLIALARAPGASWWQRLQALERPSTGLARARALLQRWLPLAGVLPVHDLLDRITFEADARRRYSAAVPPGLAAQVQANLDAFIELALTLDAGRFPSLPRFIDELAALQQHGGDEAPDEGSAAGEDAVRVMTIHGAKGIEAEVVILADTHAPPPPERPGVLVAWPPQQPAPEHFSLVAGGPRDAARAAWFAADDAQREQEDHNLLYVAATRARQALIVSGTRPSKRLDVSWYTRLAQAEALSVGAAPAQAMTATTDTIEVPDFLPAVQRTGVRQASSDDSAAQRLGRAFHALLEVGPSAALPAIARAHGLDAAQAQAASEAAGRVRASHAAFFRGGVAELDVVAADGTPLRVDRLVEVDGTWWVIDFKWSLPETERAGYEVQLRRYAAVLRSAAGGKPVRCGIITASAVFTEVH
jgi:ATP-dependent helicase/nuclease subunit A